MTDFKEDWANGNSGHIAEHNHISRYLNDFRSVEMFGAVGDGVTDDTGHLQDALDVVPNLYLPGPATYLIDGKVGLSPRSYQTIRLHPQAVIQIAPNDWGDTIPHTTRAFYLNSVQHVYIDGGQIIGERVGHIGSDGEFGYGIDLLAATDIHLENIALSNFWGDGVFLSGANARIQMQSVVSSNNRRQGMSILQVNGMTITDCVFSNSNGTLPESGVDIEPESTTVENVTFTRCEFSGNVRAGLVVSGIGTIRNIRFIDCHSHNNMSGWYSATAIDHLEILHCEASANTEDGFFVTNIDDTVLTDLFSHDNAGHGFIIMDAANIILSDAIARGNTKHGFIMTNLDNAILSDLIARQNTQCGIYFFTEDGYHNSNIVLASSIATLNGVFGIRLDALCDGISLIGNRATGNTNTNLSIHASATNITNSGNVAP